jgi:putative endonuclease
MACVYIIFSASLNRFYIGSTEGLIEDRLKKHLSDHAGFTAKVKDWRVVYKESYQNKHVALKREMQIKSWKSRMIIEGLIMRATT